MGDQRKEQALLDLMSRTGYNIMQENGQRRYGPPPDWGDNSPPPNGTEIFIGKIPRDCYEDELVPTFEKIGQIYELRLMMDFSGTNRGYGFLSYVEPRHAVEAVRKLNNFAIRPGKYIGVVMSLNNCRLFVGKIPRDKTREDIIDEMSAYTEGVVGAIVHTHHKESAKNRGYAFVEYENHRAAAMARRKLLPGKIQLFGCDIQVDWAEPEPVVSEDVMQSVKVLYVRNLNQSITDEELGDFFSFRRTMNPPLSCERVKRIKDFAFVHYSTREEAEFALKQIRSDPDFGMKLANEDGLDVTWAKPPEKQLRPRRFRNSHHSQGDHGGLYSHTPTPAPRMPRFMANNHREFNSLPTYSPRAHHFHDNARDYYPHHSAASPRHHSYSKFLTSPVQHYSTASSRHLSYNSEKNYYGQPSAVTTPTMPKMQQRCCAAARDPFRGFYCPTDNVSPQLPSPMTFSTNNTTSVFGHSYGYWQS